MSIFVGRQTLQTRLRAWAQHAPVIEKYMHAHAAEAQHDYFESLRVHRDDKRRTVQLSAGNHPIATNEDGSLRTEGGAALVLSQDTKFGHVATFIYPYESPGSTAKPILWGCFDSPADVTSGKWLDLATNDFARCSRASSLVDQTVHYSDRLRMQWLKIRSRVLRLRGWLPGCTKLIRAKPSWTKRIVAAIVLVLTTLTALLNLPSMLSTLSGYSVPALWAMWHTKPAAPSGAKPSTPQAPSPAASSVVSGSLKITPTQAGPAIAPATTSAAMPVISGRYTFCPTIAGAGSSKLLNLLYDVRANAGKVAFFDVQVGIDCVLGRQPDYEASFNRLEEEGGVSYFLRVPLVTVGDLVSARKWIDGDRDPSVLRAMHSDNGSLIAMHGENDNRNPLSRFQPHVEGSSDVLFGPYAIKESSDDAAITLDLNAPYLDTAALQQATAIADRLRGAKALPGSSSPSPAGHGGT
ncbi:hypothetical protein [Ralstonia solanacearum]|uniref:hypothetical protein n=1 Tax=Ralstonia solanacearum TaxID=305 RepID=UPI0018D0AA89|nr:hypothetical protein [Ralstonia solanacearum]